MARRTAPRARTMKDLERKEPTRTREITLNALLWEITKKFDTAIRDLQEEKEKTMHEAIAKFCPLPQKGEHIEANYSHQGKVFSYEGFKPKYGDVILYGGLVKKNGDISEGVRAETRIKGNSIKIIVPVEDE